MTTYLFADNATTTLAAGISNSATSCTLATGTGSLFPNPSAGQAFPLTFVSATNPALTEITLCTARSGDVCTIVRAQEGTSARAWNLGDFASQYWTAQTARQFVQEDQYQVGTYEVATSVAGTVNAITATLASQLSAVVVGLSVIVPASGANTGATTLNLTLGSTALGALNIVKYGASALVAGDIPSAGYPIQLVYNATAGNWLMLNPATPSVPGPIYIAAQNLVNVSNNQNNPSNPSFDSYSLSSYLPSTAIAGIFRIQGQATGASQETNVVMRGGASDVINGTSGTTVYTCFAGGTLAGNTNIVPYPLGSGPSIQMVWHTGSSSVATLVIDLIGYFNS